jgi:hypothetical protein
MDIKGYLFISIKVIETSLQIGLARPFVKLRGRRVAGITGYRLSEQMRMIGST